jgi:hypothetical protein
VKSYKTSGAAKAAITRAQKKYENRIGVYAANHGPLFELGYAEANYYHLMLETKVKRVNLMTGVEYKESVNTPLSCSPASDSYWSM